MAQVQSIQSFAVSENMTVSDLREFLSSLPAEGTIRTAVNLDQFFLNPSSGVTFVVTSTTDGPN